jgi:hypothetical protein
VTLQRSDQIRAFAEARARLNAELDALRVQVDRWLEENGGSGPSMIEIANLSAILEKRRDRLAELAALDDSFIKQLLQMNSSKS